MQGNSRVSGGTGNNSPRDGATKVTQTGITGEELFAAGSRVSRPNCNLSSEKISMLRTNLLGIMNAAVLAGKVVGTSVVVSLNGHTIFAEHVGLADSATNKPITENSIFRLASMTKPLVSAAALALVEEGRLKLDDPITKWLPDFKPQLADGTTPVITVRHLLTHTSGLAYGFLSPELETKYQEAGVSDGMDDSPSGLSLATNLEQLAKVNLLFAPGTSWCYSLSTDVLGAVLEKACGTTLQNIVARYVTNKLGMDDTTFHVSPENRAKLVTAYADSTEPDGRARVMQEKDKVLLVEGCGHIHYAPSRITNPQASASGGSGMAGTAAEYIKFLEAIRAGGSPILNAESVKLMTQDLVPGFEVPAAGPGYGFGMGFAVVRDSLTANTPRRPGSYEWGGVYGSKMFVDPESELSVVMLTNTAVHGLMGPFSADLTKAIYTAVTPEQ